jgi:hypothetical protein
LVVFAHHDDAEFGPAMLVKIDKYTGLTPMAGRPLWPPPD